MRCYVAALTAKAAFRTRRQSICSLPREMQVRMVGVERAGINILRD